MEDIKKYYKILGLKFGASPAEIKQAYKDLVKVWHPDRFSHDPRLQQKATEKLKEINEAYDQLQHYNDAFDRGNEQESEYKKDDEYQKPPTPPPPSSSGYGENNYKKRFPTWVWLIIAIILWRLITGYMHSHENTIPFSRNVLSPPPFSSKSVDEKTSLLQPSEKAKKTEQILELKNRELSNLSKQNSGNDNISGLTSDEKQSIEMACTAAKFQGPASYNRCLEVQLSAVKGLRQ